MSDLIFMKCNKKNTRLATIEVLIRIFFVIVLFVTSGIFFQRNEPLLPTV